MSGTGLAATEQGTPLRQWIFLQFLLLLIVMVAPLFAVILLATESGFRGYVYQGDVNKALAFAPLIEAEFQRVGSWDAVEPFLSQAPFSYHPSLSGDQTGPSSHSENAVQDLDWIRERIVILDTARRVVVDSKRGLVGTTHPAEHVTEAIVLKTSEGWTMGYLLVGTMVDPALTQNHETFLSTTAITLVVLFLICLALAVPLAFWLGARVARPLQSLVVGTQRAAAGDWTWTLPSGAPREVLALDDAFQKLGQNLRSSEERKARLLADAAHELRTPLTVVRGTLEAMIDGVFPMEKKTLEAVYSETIRLEKIVESLRQLEDLHSRPLLVAEFSWSEQLNRVVGLFQAQARERQQSLTVDCPHELMGWGESEAIQQILVNLVSNALRHGASRGSVLVEVSRRDQGCVLAVEDDGPGVPVADRERVFGRFVRLDPSRSAQTGGRGLGLAIVKRLVERHGGTIGVTDGIAGGARFEAWFPGKKGASQAPSVTGS